MSTETLISDGRADASSAASPLLSLRGLSKRFGAVRALTDVNLDVPAGQVTALAAPAVNASRSRSPGR